LRTNAGGGLSGKPWPRLEMREGSGEDETRPPKCVHTVPPGEPGGDEGAASGELSGSRKRRISMGRPRVEERLIRRW
jgi:hypothetical protein